MGVTLGFILGIVAMLTLGVQSYIMAKSSRRIGPLGTSLWYQAISLGILVLLAAFLFQYGGMTWWTFLILVLTGVVSVSGILAFTKGLQVGHVSLVVTVASAWGAVTAVLGVLLLGESMTWLQAAFIALIVLGTVLAALGSRSAARRKAGGLGIGYAAIALSSWGAYYFFLGFLVKALNWFSVTLFVTAITVLFLAAYGAVTKKPMKANMGSLGPLLAMGAFNVIVLFAYNIGVTVSYASIVAPISAASPLVTIILAYVLLRERLAPNQKIGVAMVLLGIVLLAV